MISPNTQRESPWHLQAPRSWALPRPVCGGRSRPLPAERAPSSGRPPSAGPGSRAGSRPSPPAVGVCFWSAWYKKKAQKAPEKTSPVRCARWLPRDGGTGTAPQAGALQDGTLLTETLLLQGFSSKSWLCSTASPHTGIGKAPAARWVAPNTSQRAVASVRQPGAQPRGSREPHPLLSPAGGRGDRLPLGNGWGALGRIFCRRPGIQQSANVLVLQTCRLQRRH